MDERIQEACITCGEVFDTETDEIGFPLHIQCNRCWIQENCQDDFWDEDMEGME